MSKYTAQLQQNYIAYFNRPADVGGLQYWETQMANGASAQTVAGYFAASSEYLAIAAGKTSLQLIDQLYVNLFGRHADTDGLAWWNQQIIDGKQTISSIAYALATSAASGGNKTPQGIADTLAITSKTTAATSYTTTTALTTADTIAYVNAPAFAVASAWLAPVVNDATLGTANTALPATITSASTAGSSTTGQTFALTLGADTFTGASGNDTFTGAATTGPTWTVGDKLDGGAGNDVFNVTQSGAVALPVGATVTNIETVNVLTDSTVTLTTTAWTGLTSLNTTGVDGATITAAATTAVSVTDAATTGGGIKAIAVNGGSTVAVTSTNNIVDTITIGATTAAAGAVTVTSTGGVANGNTGGAIAVTGGTTVTVNQNAGNAATTGVDTVGGAITVTGNASTTAVTVNQTKAATGLTATATAAGVVGFTAGGVTIADKNAASLTAAGTITTVTLNSFGDVGGAVSTINSGALTTINLSGNAIGAGLTVTDGALTTALVTTQALNLNGFKTGAGAGVITLDSKITTLNIDASTAASTIKSFVAAGATTVNITGNALLTLTADTLTAATAINVTNTAGASLGDAIGTGVTFTGGAGADTITLSNAFEKAITMGDGNDTVTYAGAASTVAGKVGSVAAGNGTDTIKMTAAQANSTTGASSTAAFNTAFTGFEVLDVATGASDVAINLAGINGVNQVVSRGVASGKFLTLDGFTSGGTLTLDAAAADATANVNANVTNAVLSSADTFNVKLSNATGATTEFGKITLAGIETVNITTVDAGTAGNTVATVDTATLIATSATKIVVTGNDGLNLTNAGNVAVTSFDASGVVGNAAEDTGTLLAVTFASANTTATAVVTITGGAGNDVLTGNAGKDTITGGAGADKLSGGLNADTLVVGVSHDVINVATNSDVSDGVFTDSSTSAFDLVNGFKTVSAATTTFDFSTQAKFLAATAGGTDLSILNITAVKDAVGAGTSLTLATEANATGSGQAIGVTYTVKDGIMTLSGTGASTVDTLGKWLVEAAAVAATDGEVVAFQYGSDTYVFAQNAAQDVLVELVGVSGAAALLQASNSTTAVAGTILYGSSLA